MAEAGANGRGNQSDAARLLLAAARERFAVAATDLLLPDQARLTEWQRLTAAALLTRLVHGLEDEMRARLAERFEGHAALHAALSSAHVPIALPILERAQVLRDAELSNVLVRRVEEHRYWKAQRARRRRRRTALRTSSATRTRRSPPRRWSWSSPAAAASTASRSPPWAQVELPAELQHKLVWMVAAALRHYIVQQHGVAAVDAAIEETASALDRRL